jgi:hypothetical protein
MSVGRLSEAVDELQSVDPGMLTDDGLADLLVEVDRQLSRLTAVQARLAAAADVTSTWTVDGSKSAAAWLARRCRRIAPNEFDEFEWQLVEHARQLGFEDFSRVCAYWCQVNDPDGCEIDAQRRADALVELAHRACTAPAGGRRPAPLVSVFVDHETLTGRLCELSRGTTITPGQLLGVSSTWVNGSGRRTRTLPTTTPRPHRRLARAGWREDYSSSRSGWKATIQSCNGWNDSQPASGWPTWPAVSRAVSSSMAR